MRGEEPERHKRLLRLSLADAGLLALTGVVLLLVYLALV